MTTTFAKALPIVAGALAAVLTPPEPIVPSAWAKDHLYVPDGPRASERWDPSLTPYVAEIIDLLGPDSPHNRVVVRKSAQTGLSIAGLAWLGSLIDGAPANMAYVLPTDEARNDFNSEKLTPTIEHTSALNKKIRKQLSRSGDGSTAKKKKFPGGTLNLLNANSAPDLRSKTLKYAVADEVDEWPDDLEGQGDPWELFEGRFISFHASADWKIFEISTPTIKGSSRIDADFEVGDQRFLFCKCPHCGARIRLLFENLRYNPKPPYQAHYVCQESGCIIEPHEKPAMLRGAKFKATNVEEGLYPSFHVDALTSQLTTWDKIAEKFVQAKGDPRKEKTFWNIWLGLAYEMRGDAPDFERLMERREEYAEGVIPPRGLLLTAGCDVQHTGIWAEVIAFAPDKQSWTVTARWLEGDTTDANGGAFLLLAALYDEWFSDSFGGQRQLDAMAIDAGDGGRANQVYTFVRSRPRAYAIKGLPGWTTPAIGTPSKVDIRIGGKKKRRGATLWPVGTWSLKAEFYTNLRKVGMSGGQEFDPPGYCHFGAFLGINFFKQITAEYLTDELHRGRRRKVWKESGENHLLDCRIYGMAMADHLGLHRKTETDWLMLAKERGVPEELRNPDLLSPLSVRLEAMAAASAKQGPAPASAPSGTENDQPPAPDRSSKREARRNKWKRR